MTIDSAMQLFREYGILILFLIAMAEAMNCPGMPAGVILPAAGILGAETGGIPRLMLIYAAMLAGAVLGSVLLYGIGRLGGRPLEAWLEKHRGKPQEKLERELRRIRRGTWQAMFVCRLIPVARTLGSLFAGICGMPLRGYLAGTVLGVALYNAVGIGLGYFAGWLFI